MTTATLKEIQIVFPVRGHSFLTADRVFGRVEKDLRKKTVITIREDYHDLLLQHGRVNILGKDWKYYDIKNLDKHFKKVEGIRDMKRICIEKKQIKKRTEAIVKCFRNFRFENAGESKGINPLKRNTNLLSIKLVGKELGHFIKGAKKKDVESLLTKQFGENWKNDPSLKWYCDILYENNISENDNENGCDCLEPDCGELHV
ncbi:hypothetical protein PYW08_011518 [Mythimna loreyi]|uniref:Uncharacterized protein n=1 Tax=Mythimna loreyi TaxID=667449 RepID=A0ACC2QJK6_9NEOP|nr:hypothetical protein PYW08_011518 [Mythimna loreyi]